MRPLFHTTLYIVICTLLMAGSWSFLESRVRLKSKQLIAEKYPGCNIVAGRLKLSKSEQIQIKHNARVKFVASSYSWFRIDCAGKLPVFALKDSHRVRSKKETILVFIDQTRTILDVEILDFQEPTDYLAPDRWLQLLHGKGLKDSIMPGNDLSAISGATMTSNAISSAVRRALTLQGRLI